MPPSPDHSAASITGRSFAVRRKGFDPDEVRAYLGQLAEVISRLTSELDGARGDVSSLQQRLEARPEIDEDQLTEVLGEETARVLSSARQAAVAIKERAEENGARLRREAVEDAGATRRDADADAVRVREEAAAARLEADEAARATTERAEEESTRIRGEADGHAETVRAEAEAAQEAATAAAGARRSEAEADATRTRAAADEVLAERTAEADAAAAVLREQAEAEASTIRRRAEDEAAGIRTAGDAERDALRAEGREMVAEAKRVRERMLADLARRRKVARVQLEQLQAGRDRLLEVYEGVQSEIDAATSGLRTALPEARRAAEAARVRADAAPADTVGQLEEQIAAARAAGLPLVAAEEGGDDTDDADLTEAHHIEVPIQAADDVGEETQAIDVLDDELSADVTSEADGSLDGEAGPEEDAGPDAAEGGTGGHPTDPEGAPVDLQASAIVGDAAPSGDGGGDIEVNGDEGEVDELFARLRASQVPVEGDDDAPAPGEPAPGTDPGASAPSATSADASGPPDVGADDVALVELLERRDGAIEPLEHRVARRLKRVLADEQGRVLDGVRRAKGAPDLDEILPLDEQVGGYATAVLDDLLAAAEEGAGFEGAALPPSTSLEGVAEELGRSLAGVVRPRIDRCFAAGDDTDDTSDQLRATYREWKTDSLVEATRHHVLAAFGEGQCAVRPAGAPVRWVPDPTGSACPDCEDDALAGTVPSGEVFPTGHSHPPAHPGCRCLVVGERVGAPA